MPASVRVEIISITSAVIKLVNKPQRECTQNFCRERWKKIWSR